MFSQLFSCIVGWLTLSFLPPRWRVCCFILIGAAIGLAIALANVSRVTSYASDDSAACVNCHVMRPQYDAWRRSSHARDAQCNDCHVPHDNIVHKYAFKARDGLYHSAIFTLRMEPQVIHMSSMAIPVVEENCRRCHEETLQNVCLKSHQEGDLRCWDCHRETAHGRARSLSATPLVMSPSLPSVSEPQIPTIGGRAPRANHQSQGDGHGG